jgi:hypothetical protein
MPSPTNYRNMQVIFHLLHWLPLGSDRKQDLDQAGADQPLRRNRWTTEISVKHLELGIEACQRVVDDPTDQTQRMPRRNAFLKINIAEQRTARLIRPTHRHPRRNLAKGESCSANRVER